jgi:carbon-monoxide dehydrogenase medium subunit
MHAFAYHRPGSPAEAAALRATAPDGVYLAGGMTLIPTLKQRLAQPSDVIDLGAIAGLAGIRREGERLVIGAMTRHAEVAGSADVRGAIPALAALAGHIGDRQVRYRGTIGGSLANSDPAADYPAAVIALGAVIVTDRRRIAAESYFKDLFETALAPGELITEVAFRIPRRAAWRKFPNPASRYAIVGVFAAEVAGEVRIGVTGDGPCAFRASGIEQALKGRLDPAAIDGAPLDASRFNTDLHASA